MNHPARTVILATTAIGVALAAISPAIAAQPANEAPGAAAARASQNLTDLDDFLSKPEYAKYVGQQAAYSSRRCEELFPDTEPQPTPNALQQARALLQSLPADEPRRELECATIQVPKNWYDPTAGDIQVATYRLNTDATDLTQRTKRLLLTNPGGPGGSGLVFGILFPLTANTGNTHVSVGIDPRGVGGSTNITCPEKNTNPTAYLANGDYRHPTLDSLRAAQADTDEYIKGCLTAQADLAPFINTDQTARDFNYIRHVLGYDTADYYGVSYGTWLGAHIERSFPNRFDRVILDGNIDWGTPNMDHGFEMQVPAMQAATDQLMLTFLARHHDTFTLGDHPLAVNRTIERLVQGSSEGKLPGSTPQMITMLLNAAIRETDSIGPIGMLLKDMRAHIDGKAPADGPSAPARAQAFLTSTKTAAGPSLFNEHTFAAVRCGDTANSTEREAWHRKRLVYPQQFPVQGPIYMTNMCAAWNLKPAMSAESFNRPVSQVLMLQQEADPATAYNGAYHARFSAAGTVRMVTVDDLGGHGLAQAKSPCAKEQVDAYLLRGRFPSQDITCQAGPLSTPLGFLIPEEDPANAKRVSDTQAFEFMNPTGPGRALPKPYVVGMRVLQPQRPDADGAPTPKLGGEPATDPARERVTAELQRHLAQINTPPTFSR